ncbi:Uncharacterized protein FWK35_00006733 [Aphis craccivora]|uniref:Uncharacterized protein n=1 Tax=Aphis craccivora TaxID=307492 RepID=A0A6G0ZB96_APHCR|nr:Uncharacterized protein FWK35_00006733 [Aphis craccivora]
MNKTRKTVRNLWIEDTENVEPPQQSSTPSKHYKTNSKRILKDNNKENINDVRGPELFHSDLEDEPTVTENLTVATTTINDSRDDSDDKWTTFSDVSEDRSCNIVTDLLTEIDVRFKKPPRRSYAGKKRNNKSLYEDKEEEEEEHKKIPKT